jgi:hypothetical protein
MLYEYNRTNQMFVSKHSPPPENGEIHSSSRNSLLNVISVFLRYAQYYVLLSGGVCKMDGLSVVQN